MPFIRQSGFRPPTLGHQGPRRFAPRACPPRTGPAARFGEPPPRDRKDTTCINCNRKGHSASQYKQPRVEVMDRKCFTCGKPGHVARDCTEKKAPSKAILDAGTAQRPAVMCVQLAPPRRQGGQLVDHIHPAEPRRSNGNRYQPLTHANAGFWEDVSRTLSLLKPCALGPCLAQGEMSRQICMDNSPPVRRRIPRGPP